jgi:large subunit ribosomal protein L19
LVCKTINILIRKGITMDISALGKNKINPNLPKLSPGDNVRVSFKIKEANRERVQTFPGLIIKVARHNSGGNFTVRRVTSGVGVEHTFPLASPLLEKIEVVRHGKVRRSKLYYIRRLSTKEARLKERRESIVEAAAKTVVEEVVVSPEASNPATETK